MFAFIALPSVDPAIYLQVTIATEASTCTYPLRLQVSGHIAHGRGFLYSYSMLCPENKTNSFSAILKLDHTYFTEIQEAVFTETESSLVRTDNFHCLCIPKLAQFKKIQTALHLENYELI